MPPKRPDTSSVESNDVWTPSQGINDFVRGEFTTGGCFELAAVLHRRAGWPIYGHVLQGELVHAWAVNPEGRAVDIHGVHAGAVAFCAYTQMQCTDTQGVERSHVGDPINLTSSAFMQEADLTEWAEELLVHFPEHFSLTPDIGKRHTEVPSEPRGLL